MKRIRDRYLSKVQSDILARPSTSNFISAFRLNYIRLLGVISPRRMHLLSLGLEDVLFSVLRRCQFPSRVNYIYISITLYLIGIIVCLRR